jgi:hypothetical protein
VEIAAEMPGMAMRPVIFAARAAGGGRYEATGALTMFGHWRLTVRLIPRSGGGAYAARVLACTFVLNLDLPPGLLQAVAEHATRQ